MITTLQRSQPPAPGPGVHVRVRSSVRVGVGMGVRFSVRVHVRVSACVQHSVVPSHQAGRGTRQLLAAVQRELCVRV